MRRQQILLILAVAYGAASCVHFLHNGIYLHQYPNMPPSLTSTGVYVAWLLVAASGCGGYALHRFGWPRTGLVVLALYAALGFAGLDHYVLAPPARHTPAMHATIWCEVAAAAALLVFSVYSLFAGTRVAAAEPGGGRCGTQRY